MFKQQFYNSRCGSDMYYLYGGLPLDVIITCLEIWGEGYFVGTSDIQQLSLQCLCGSKDFIVAAQTDP